MSGLPIHDGCKAFAQVLGVHGGNDINGRVGAQEKRFAHLRNQRGIGHMDEEVAPAATAAGGKAGGLRLNASHPALNQLAQFALADRLVGCRRFQRNPKQKLSW